MRRADLRVPGALLWIWAAALALRLIFFAGFVGFDDTYYIDAAHRLAMGDWTPRDSQFGLRLGLIVPAATLYRLFGVSDATTGLFPLLCSLATIPLAFAIGRAVASEQVGLVAAALLAVLPLDVIFASQLVGTAPASLLAGLTLLFYLRARETSRSRSFFAAGVCLGLGWLCADVVLFCVIPLACDAAFRARREPRAVWILVGLATVAVGESIYYAAVTGDPWYRVATLVRQGATQGDADALSSGLGPAYAVQPFLRLVSEQELGLFPVFLAPAIWLAVRRPSTPGVRLLALWVVTIFLYTSYGTVSPLRFAPLPRLPRYLASVVVPAVILLAAWLTTLRPRRRQLSLAALVASSLFCIAVDNGRSAKAPRRALAAFLGTEPCVRAVVPGSLVFDVLYYQGFRPSCPLDVLVADEDAARAMKEGRPSVRPVVGLDGADDTYVVMPHPADAAALARVAGAPVVATFIGVDRLYYRLLANPVILKLLAATRDRHRMEGLATLRIERIDVYRVPPSRPLRTSCSDAVGRRFRRVRIGSAVSPGRRG